MTIVVTVVHEAFIVLFVDAVESFNRLLSSTIRDKT